MKAAVFEAFQQPLTVRNVPDPHLLDTSVIIEVHACGVCRSDWHAWMGHDPTIRLPHVPGHELAGVIAATGKDVQNWQVGARVTTPFCGGCGHCPQCISGHQHICDNDYQPGFHGWGAFAEYVMIPHADINLVQLPETLSFIAAASLGCRFITAFHALNTQANLRPGEWLVVHGCGGVGLSAIMIAAAQGARVIAIDIHPEKLELARALGAAYVINARTEDVVSVVQDVTAGGAQVSLDALGSALTCQNSVRSLAKRGRHVQVGLMLADDANPRLPMHEVIAKELVLLGSHGMPAHRYDALFAMMRAGILEPEKLIGQTVSLHQASDALASMGTFTPSGVTVIDLKQT